MNKISACLIVRNEEKLLVRCLNSLSGAVDEIILVHDGPCSDQTLNIAQKYGAKIFIQPFVGGAEEHRPFSFKQASYNWILQIDADEFLSPELKGSLAALVARPNIAAYEFFWPLWDGGKGANAHWPYKRVLFRKDKISFLGILQFVVQINGKIKRMNLKLHHQPEYNNYSLSSFRNKQLPWAKLQAKYYFKKFIEINKFNYIKKDFSFLIKCRRTFPLLFLPLDLIWTFCNNYIKGAYKLGLLGLKLSLMSGFYRGAVDYYIFKIKRNQKYD